MELKDLKSYVALQKKDPILAGQVELVYKLTTETINGISRYYDNYTMHDMNHGLRVAAYMEDIAFGIDQDIDKRIEEFNGLELALMILSAILHDIGMFIRDQDLQDIKHNIIRHNSKSLTFEGVLKVVSSEDEAVKEIIRLTHAARIEEFVNQEFDGHQTIASILQLNGKYSYAEDLIQICKAHGEDYGFISSMRSELTKGEYTYNLQYLAVLLRIADLLDLDRQRTPILWYSMIELKEFSRDEWEKHFIIQNEKKFKPHFDGKMQIYFDGKSMNAKIHRKYLRYIDQLKEELERADNLLNFKNANKKYQLFVSTKVENRVQTIGFEYADLRLNLDYSSITELLMGKNIYGDSRLGLRELIQNSIDACKLMEEINRDEGDYPEPSITISFSKNKNYVKVKDTGIGMTLDVVKRHFLNVGRSYYKSNEYRYKSHTYQPIGQYGIGFLACFLLSDTVQVKTKHYSNNEITHLELERNSEYVVTNTEETGSFWGTEITLDYEKFFDIFKNEDNLNSFLSEYFYTDIPIYLKNDDGGKPKKRIQNTCAQIMKKEETEMPKDKTEEIDFEGKSQVLSGKVRILMSDSPKNITAEELPKTVYLLDPKSGKFLPTDSNSLEFGYYRMVDYLNHLADEDYERIKSTHKSASKKHQELRALAQKNGSRIVLLFSDELDIDFYDMYVDDGELKINGRRIKDIITDSGLKFYKEFLSEFGDYKSVFLSKNHYLHVHYCAFEKYVRPYHFKGESEPTFFLYNKGIYVNDFMRMSCPYPCRAQGVGYIKYFGDELKLDVSRKSVISGIEVLQHEVTGILLREFLTKEAQPAVKELVEKMIRFN